ncbi:50S ribosomal protein L32 [Candidatus Parcubacteria bacterium]|jgi:large subunit ribosomal protein L32|nr:50S ribosomal protein L32 [Candidatus Parcubacteria bacterium]MBT7228175.1 50S ribosomal protein L32 [Candidatus Parcubacteria bacterium]
MSVPKKRKTKAASRRHGSHFAIKGKSTVKCSNCGVTLLPHRACAKCGYYKGEKKLK